MKNPQNVEVREVEAWAYDDGWTYNQTWLVGVFKTSAKNISRAFTRYLKKQGIVFKKNRTLVWYDGDCYEIVDRKTKEPLFVAIPER